MTDPEEDEIPTTMGPYKTLLHSVLKQVDNDMGEEIMEMTVLSTYTPSFEDLHEEDAIAIIENLRMYQAENLNIQGESIQHLDLNIPNP